MKTKCAFWVAGVGVLLGAALRCIQMLFFFDYDTGFVTDSGVLTILYSGVTLVAAVVSGVLCLADRRRCGSLLRGRSWSAGVSALLVGVFLLLCAAALFWDAYIYRAFGVSYFVLPSQVGAHVPFAVFTALFGAAAVAAAVLWMRGKAFPGKAGVLWALGVVWGVGYSKLAMFAGVFEMIARGAFGLFLVPRFGFLLACFASPMAWLLADAFLIFAYCRVMRHVRQFGR